MPFAKGYTPHNRREPRVLVEDRGYATPCHVWNGARLGAYGKMGDAGGVERLAHRVLWEAEHGPLEDGTDLHHRCEVPLCVRLDHLEPLLHLEHARRHGRVKLTIEDARAIKGALREGAHPRDLATSYGVSAPLIYNIRAGRKWAHAR